jgi:hypothetical protein
VDEKPEGVPRTYGNPQDELRAIYREKTGAEISADVESRVWEAAELRDYSMQRFVEELRPHVANAWRNPAGFLTNFARKFEAQ